MKHERKDGATVEVESPQAELLDVDEVAAMLNCSRRTVYRLADTGRMPPAIRLRSLVRWNRQVIRQWIADGCPPCRRRR